MNAETFGPDDRFQIVDRRERVPPFRRCLFVDDDVVELADRLELFVRGRQTRGDLSLLSARRAARRERRCENLSGRRKMSTASENERVICERAVDLRLQEDVMRLCPTGLEKIRPRPPRAALASSRKLSRRRELRERY